MKESQGKNRSVDNERTCTGRRRFLLSVAAGAVAAPFSTRAFSAPETLTIDVWTGVGCGCCKEWVRHLEESGFEVTSEEGGNIEARKRLGMPVKYGSCHTAEIDGYAIEGHVPAADIRRLVAERPDAVGIAVPAMPRGSPGMDGPGYGGVRDPYDVLLVDRNGETTVFQSYR